MFLVLVDTKVVDSLGFVDDFKFFVKERSVEDYLTLQRGIDLGTQWSNFFEINVKKGVIMSHARRRQNVLFLYCLRGRDLGQS